MKPLLAAALSLILSPSLFCQPSMPSWLVTYPGATAATKTFKSLVEATYMATAAPPVVTDHYRKLFEAQNLPFQPNSDGIGTTIRGAAAECDLLISIRAQRTGTLVSVSCAAKSPSFTTSASPQVVTTPTTTSTPRSRTGISRQQSQEEYNSNVAAALERHKQRVAEMGIHRTYQDADAPPLVWPDWLVHIQGAELKLQQGIDPAKNEFLKSRYVTSEPMSAIYAFYKDLLRSHGYPIHSGVLATGQTTSGIQQNAYGRAEGINYPNGHPGPWTEIKVHFSRFHLNDPITVDLLFTTYKFQAPKHQGF